MIPHVIPHIVVGQDEKSLEGCIQGLAERYCLRYIEKYKRYVGIYR